jgi:hypothetical protein
MFYILAISALIALPVEVIRLAHILKPGTATTFIRRAASFLVLVIAGKGIAWVQLRTVPVDGMQRLVSWLEARKPQAGVIADDTDVPQLVIAQYGLHTVVAGTLAQSRAENVQYITIFLISVQ